ncbi:hypothetical protein [Pseudonocardia broussonetiae]|uniref:HK97 gp10 family phage protein n=1 Tax=Pseudonocardia broussonetiae TaxID=2736640 RepID=A0A6M6JHJ3_9PSEU|nr:hypothetical protein [Pseudonocardia broussonetiae]QJY46653.1 hypothetical protein HOP40_13190 [Pseudonocardia broussonetiae]
MKITVRIPKHRQFGALARRFRAAGDGTLERDLGAGLQQSAPPVLAKVHARVMAASFPASPSKGGGRSTGFRAALAGATKTEPLASPVGVRFFVDGDALGRGGTGRAGHRLAMYTEGIARNRWRHRAFGRDPEDPKSWFNQLPDPWFFPTFPGEESRFVRVVEQAMDKTARRILG